MKKYTNTTLKQTMYEIIDSYFESLDAIDSTPISLQAPESILTRIQSNEILPEGRALEDVVDTMMQDIYPYRLVNNHPRQFGFIPGPASPLSLLGDIMTQAHNIHASNFVNSSAATTAETYLIQYFANKIGYSAHAGGLFVSGGSAANLTALIAARDATLDQSNRDRGIVYISEQTHHSVNKALHIIGFAPSQIRYVKTTFDFKLDPHHLNLLIHEDLAHGFIPCIIIATAGTTNTGAVDDLRAIALIKQEHNMWLHVDGAYGASFLLSPTLKHECAGIELADSVSWDAHKFLFQTYACAMVIVKDKKYLSDSFSANPEYLKDIGSDHHIDYGSYGIELTRPARALKLWLTLQVLGENQIAAAIDHGQTLAKYAESIVVNHPQLTLVSHAHFAILNFRYHNTFDTAEALDHVNTALAHRMVASGDAGVYTTILNGQTVLRMCTINPQTTTQDIDATFQALNDHMTAILSTKEH